MGVKGVDALENDELIAQCDPKMTLYMGDSAIDELDFTERVEQARRNVRIRNNKERRRRWAPGWNRSLKGW